MNVTVGLNTNSGEWAGRKEEGGLMGECRFGTHEEQRIESSYGRSGNQRIS